MSAVVAPGAEAVRTRTVDGRPEAKSVVFDGERAAPGGRDAPAAVNPAQKHRGVARLDRGPSIRERATGAGWSGPQPAAGDGRTQLRRIERDAGERLEDRRGRRSAQHAAAARQHEGGGPAAGGEHEERLPAEADARKPFEAQPVRLGEPGVDSRAELGRSRAARQRHRRAHRLDGAALGGGFGVRGGRFGKRHAVAARKRDARRAAGGGKPQQKEDSSRRSQRSTGGRERARPASSVRPSHGRSRRRRRPARAPTRPPRRQTAAA